MAAPVWQTPPGTLGTIVENEFYQIQLSASNTLTYEYLSGVLPDGIRITSNGLTEGFPKSVDYIAGVPQEVGTDVTSEFAVRATSEDGLVADRVFSMTITGPDDPVIDALPSSDLGSYFDGQLVNVSLTATDPDPLDTQSWKVIGGELPGGVTLSTSGLLYGWLIPVPTEIGTPGYDVNNFDIGTYDFTTQSISKSYDFTIEVVDSTGRTSTKDYSVYVASRNILTTDNTDLTTDGYAPTASSLLIGSKITADLNDRRSPHMVTEPADLGTILHDNYFNYQFVGRDLDGDILEFSLTTGAALGFDADGSGFDQDILDRGTYVLPPGLTVDATSGWMTGYIPAQSAVKTDYQFAVKCFKKDYPEYESELIYFTLTIIGNIAGVVTWPASDLGTIDTGQVSEIDVRASISNSKPVLYELKTTKANKLPQGLRLESNGLVTGRVSFELMMFDTGTTTFDDTSNKLVAETTFEREETNKFSVRAYSNDLTIDTFQEFTISVKPSSFKPYESLYIKALPVIEQRDIYSQLINNADDIDPDDIYRNGDVNFGVQDNIRALVASGLNPVPETDYIEAMAQNHFNNTLRFGGLKVAYAYNADGTGKYDIVYVDLVDKSTGIDPTTLLPAPASQKIDLQKQQSITTMSGFTKEIRINDGWPKVDSGNLAADQGNYRYAYPNAIENMRSRMRTAVGQAVLERLTLPEWMQDKQIDDAGKVLGWTLAAPIVYCQPGQGDKIAYLLAQRTTIDLKKISFEVDRYILDNNLSKHYNKTTNKWLSTAETTFDVVNSQTNPSYSAAMTIDGNQTRFYASVDKYADPDDGDIYLKFPQRSVFR
jgi:hypothetical protein